jgi:type I restriction enzyme S subunit
MTAQLNGQALPNSWVWTQIEAVTQSMKNGVYKPPTAYADHGIACLRMYNIEAGKIVWKDIKRMKLSNDEVLAYELLPGDILVNRVNSRELVGKAAVIPNGLERCVYESKNIRVRLVKNAIDSRYAGYWFHLSAHRYFNTNAQQTVGMASINQEQIGAMPCPLAPLNEQQRIVAAIETQFTRLDAAVVALKRSQANLKRYRAAVLKAACEGRLVPTEAELAQAEGRSYEPAAVLLERILAERHRQWETENPKKKYQEPVAPDTSTLPELPEGWCWASMDQLVSKIEAGKSPKAENRPAKPDELGVLKVSAVSWGEFQPKENKTLFHKSLVVDNLSVKAGDVLISRANTVELVGAVVLVRQDYPNLLLSDKTLRLVFVSDKLLRFYIIQALRTPWVRRVYEELATGTSDSMRNLSQEKILSAPVPLPPFVEQQTIVAELERRFSLITQLEKTIETDLARANRLRQSILKRAFAGQLVPQDPNDEPASLLLARLP